MGKLKLTKDNFEDRCDLDLYTSIDTWAARELAEIYDGQELSLNGLEEITSEVAAALEFHTYRLELNGLKEVSDEVAEILSHHEGDLGLDGVQELSSVAAEYLSRHDGECGLIYLNGLKRLTNERGHVLLANHLASYFDYDELELNGLEILEELPAKELAKHPGLLSLDGLKDASYEVLEIFAIRDHSISLKGMVCPEDIEWLGEVEFKE